MSQLPGNRIQLPDGRWLGYAEYGHPSGQPLLYFPGTPGSRLLHPPEEPTVAHGARLIVVERPGFGLSSQQPRRTLLDWPDDVAAFADQLELGRFAAVGVSAGGPYAAACAYKMPQRLSAVGIVSGVGPIDVPGSLQEMPRGRRLGAVVARCAPWLLLPLLSCVANPQRDVRRFFKRMESGASDVDRAVLARPDLRAMLLSSYVEATRQGLRGFVRDSVIVSNRWGFQLQDITVPVHLWHGEQDANVSLSAARYVAQAIPNCQPTFFPQEGHWLFIDHWGEIVAALLGTQGHAGISCSETGGINA